MHPVPSHLRKLNHLKPVDAHSLWKEHTVRSRPSVHSARIFFRSAPAYIPLPLYFPLNIDQIAATGKHRVHPPANCSPS